MRLAREISETQARANGSPDPHSLFEDMRSFCPDITRDSIVTVITWQAPGA